MTKAMENGLKESAKAGGKATSVTKRGRSATSKTDPVVTREMRDVGASILSEPRESFSWDYLAERVYIAMARRDASRP